MIKYLQSIDIKVLNWINVKWRNKWFDRLMPMITAAGNLGIIWIVISVFLISKKDYRILGNMIIVGLIITTIVGEGIIKNVVRRKRPYHGDDNRKLLISKPITYSFPSGHTASSFAVAAIFIKTDNAASFGIITLATLIAFSRIYLGVHYPSDVLGGAIIGFICGMVTVFIFM